MPVPPLQTNRLDANRPLQVVLREFACLNGLLPRLNVIIELALHNKEPVLELGAELPRLQSVKQGSRPFLVLRLTFQPCLMLPLLLRLFLCLLLFLLFLIIFRCIPQRMCHKAVHAFINLHILFILLTTTQLVRKLLKSFLQQLEISVIRKCKLVNSATNSFVLEPISDFGSGLAILLQLGVQQRHHCVILFLCYRVHFRTSLHYFLKSPERSIVFHGVLSNHLIGSDVPTRTMSLSL